MLSNILNNTLSCYTYSNLYPIMHDILENIKKITLSCYTYSEIYPIMQDILENIYKKYPICEYHLLWVVSLWKVPLFWMLHSL